MLALPTSLLDISASPQVPLDQLLNKPGVRMASIAAVAPTPAQAPLIGFGTIPEMVRSAQFSTAGVPDIRVYAVPGTAVLGASTILLHDRILSSADVLPPYVRLFYNRGLVRGPERSPDNEVRLDHPVYIITNYNTDHYGHFLLECLPRMLLAKHLYDLGLRFPILLPSTFPDYAMSVMRSVFGNADTIIYDIDHDIVKADTVLLPGMGHTDYIFHGCLVAMLRKLGKTLKFGEGCMRMPGKKLYVSRANVRESSHSFSRNVLNEEQIRQAATDRGYEVIYPELMPWPEQVWRFSQANRVVGEYASSMHNAMFSPPETKVLLLNWVNDVQQRLAQSCQHRIGFIMPQDGHPRWFSTDRSVRQDYAVDPWAFARALESM